MSADARPSQASVEAQVNCEPMFVRYAKEFHVSEHLCESESGLLRRVNRFIVYYFGAYLCNVDLEASRCEEVVSPPPAPPATGARIEPASVGAIRGEATTENVTAERAKTTIDFSVRHLCALVRRRFGGLPQSRWKRQLRFNWIPQVLLATFCACEVYLLVTAYYQYSYDFDVLRLRELQKRHTGGGDGGGGGGTVAQNATQQLVELVKSRIVTTKVTLDCLGSDYSHLTILAGGFYMSVVLLAFLTHLPIYLHHRYQRPFDQCHIVRDLLDQKRENELSVRMVASQVDKFVESSRVYHANLIAFPGTPVAAWKSGAKLGIDLFARSARQVAAPGIGLGAMSRRNTGAEVPGMVHEMLASGALVPLYKLRSWVRRRTLMQFVHHAFLGLYTIFFDIALVWGFLKLANHERPQGEEGEEEGAQQKSTQLFFQLAYLGSLVIAIPSLILQPPITMLIAREQIHYIGELRRMIRQCIVQNFKLADLLLSRRDRLSHLTGFNRVKANKFQNKLERTMNSNLIFVILHYKIFVAQLTPMLLTLGVQFVVGLSVLISLPIMVRVHIPYMRQLYEDRLTDAQIRIFAIAISASGAIPINMLTMPICHMYAQCERLYRDLNYLAAHISEVKSWQGCHDLYDNHVQSCLLKELSDPKRLLGQLTARAGPISGTYKNLVRGLFWYGLILAAIMADNSNSGTGKRDFLSSLINDPLGVYDDIYTKV